MAGLVAVLFPLVLASAYYRAKELRIEKFRRADCGASETARSTFTEKPSRALHRRPVARPISLNPIEYVTPQGMNYSLFLDVTSITDGAVTTL